MLPVCTRGGDALQPAAQPSAPQPSVAQPSASEPSVEECKRCMALYEELESDIKSLTARLKVLRSLKTSTSDVISRFLRHNNKDEISTKDDRLHLKLECRDRKLPLGKKQLRARMREAFDGDDVRYDAFEDRVYGQQTVVSTTTLKRMRPPRRGKTSN
jgi:hypothetical protein